VFVTQFVEMDLFEIKRFVMIQTYSQEMDVQLIVL